MPFIIADRVRETSTTVGTGSIALAGAVTGYRTFASVMASTDTTYYTIADQGGPNWEVGIGTFTSPSTLARTTVLSSSNGGSLVNFTSGTKDVFISLTASRTNVSDQPNVIDTNSSSAALRITQTGAGNAILVEDSANPDSTPFLVNASGDVIVGRTGPAIGSKFEVQSDTVNAHVGILSVSDTIRPTTINIRYRLGATAVQNGDLLGVNEYRGFDGTNTIAGALISAAVDGTPGTNDMPGRLVFSTTADGASSPTERMRITNAGRVGIGTTNPGARLAVVHDRATGGFAQTWSTFNGATFENDITLASDGSAARFGNFQSFPLAFLTNNLERMRIDAAGNVGIGTSSPSSFAPFTVARGAAFANQNIASFGDATMNRYLRIHNVTAGGNTRTAISGQFDGSDSNNFDLLLNPTSGNVGIGTPTPGYPLTINRSGATDSYAQWTNGGGGNLIIGTQGNADALLYNVSNSNMVMFTNSSERMRITNAGNVGIGTSTPNSTLALGNSVVANGFAANQIRVYDDGTNVFGFGVAPAILGYRSDNHVFYTNAGSPVERMRIDASGNALINTTTAVSRLTVNGDVAGTFFVNPTTVSANYTIPTNYNAMTAGPITVNSGVTVTVPSGSTWTVL